MNPPPKAITELPTKTFDPGEVVIEEGSAKGALYFLATGALEVVKDGVEIAVVTDEGAVFGEMSVLLDMPHTATVRAKERSQCHVAADPGVFLTEHPEAALYVAEILARRLNALNRYLVDVKVQFKDRGDHLSMLDNVLDTLMTKHPRTIARRDPNGP